jgi:hypothetical protein
MQTIHTQDASGFGGPENRSSSLEDPETKTIKILLLELANEKLRADLNAVKAKLAEERYARLEKEIQFLRGREAIMWQESKGSQDNLAAPKRPPAKKGKKPKQKNSQQPKPKSKKTAAAKNKKRQPIEQTPMLFLGEAAHIVTSTSGPPKKKRKKWTKAAKSNGERLDFVGAKIGGHRFNPLVDSIDLQSLDPRKDPPPKKGKDGFQIGRWTVKEHSCFKKGLDLYASGKSSWEKIAKLVKTRSVIQTRTHAQKYFKKLYRSGVVQKTPKQSSAEGNIVRPIYHLPSEN